MRRKDREVTDSNKIYDILSRCHTMRIAMNDGIYPYVIPMNFGMTLENDKFTFYMHCANQGKKLDLIKQNPHIAFEVDCRQKLVTGDTACDYTMDFESVCGTGTVTIINDIEGKIYALNQLMKKFTGKSQHDFNSPYMSEVTILKIQVDNITGKIHKSPQGA